MTVIALRSGPLSVSVSTSGGALLGAWWSPGEAKYPLLRPAPNDAAPATATACFPLVPFGNRVRGNAFHFAGQDYRFQPNTPFDPHHLHGDGWLGDWSVVEQADDAVTLAFRKATGDETPYRYRATQTVAIRHGAIALSLSVTNEGGTSLPFGLGWHPYFPLTPETTLQATARHYRSEVADFLPGEVEAFPADLDFSETRQLPRRWVNNGLEDWCRRARIAWPERGIALDLEASPRLRHAFLFVSDRAFDPAYDGDYFCFEPMSHRADGHHLPGLGDLQVLRPEETLSGTLRLRPSLLSLDA